MDAAPGYRPFPAYADWVADDVPSVVDPFFVLLRETKAGASDESLRAAVETATRYAAVDTGAIEGLYTTSRGFTRTIATQAASWQAALAQRGEDVARSINDQLEGYEMVLDAATRHTPVSESWIRQLHEVLCRSQERYDVFTAVGPQRQPLPKGVYKTMPNNPTNADTGRLHHYTPPDDTPAEMARLVAELRSEGFTSAHPVVQCAYAHYAFVCVHPFADGNGRVARALASTFLYREPGIPLVIFADQKDEYLDALEAADGGHPRAFVGFIAQRVIDTIELVRLTLSAEPASDVQAALAELAGSAGRGGLSFQELDALRGRLVELVRESVTSRLAGTALVPNVTAEMQWSSVDAVVGPSGYRDAPQGQTPVLAFVSAPPAAATRSVVIVVHAARAAAPVADYLITAGDAAPLEIHLRDIHPVETQVLDLKVDVWLAGVIAGNLKLLAEAARRRLEEQGYL